MKLTSQICVLNARRYQMTDDKTGEVVAGVKITYIEEWSGELRQNESGVEVLSAIMDYSDWDKFANLPALYDAEFKMSAGSRGRPTLRLISAKYVQPFAPFGAGGAKR